MKVVVEATSAPGRRARCWRSRTPCASGSATPPWCSACAVDGRVHLVANFAPAAVERGLRAGDVVRAAAKVAGGGGGGRDTMAQAGGRDPEKLPDALGHGAARDRASAVLMGRVLALDHGAARCGCAVSDPSGTLASVLPVGRAPGHPRGPCRDRRAGRATTPPSAWWWACR